jgi:hypothetical protein
VKPTRVYADTSVFGGTFDTGFSAASAGFFDSVHEGRFSLVVSTLVQDEIEGAPENVRALWREMLVLAELVRPSAEALALQDAYLAAGILSPRWKEDALHVAMATVHGCPIILSWNFRHIVNFRKIPLFNGVNVSKGYTAVTICSPLEMIEDDD